MDRQCCEKCNVTHCFTRAGFPQSSSPCPVVTEELESVVTAVPHSLTSSGPLVVEDFLSFDAEVAANEQLLDDM